MGNKVSGRRISVSGIHWAFGVGGLTVSLGLLLAALAGPAAAGETCCGITAIEARTGMVTAKETTKGMAAGRTFQFKVADRKALTGLKVGQPIHADFKTMKVSLNPDGAQPCCSIVNLRTLRP